MHFHNFCSFPNAADVRANRLFMSALHVPSSVTVPPRYTNSFTYSSYWLPSLIFISSRFFSDSHCFRFWSIYAKTKSCTGIMNILDTAVSLPKGTQVAQLQPVEVIEAFEHRSKERAGQECVDKLLDGSDVTLSCEGRSELKKCLMNSKIFCLRASMIWIRLVSQNIT